MFQKNVSFEPESYSVLWRGLDHNRFNQFILTVNCRLFEALAILRQWVRVVTLWGDKFSRGIFFGNVRSATWTFSRSYIAKHIFLIQNVTCYMACHICKSKCLYVFSRENYIMIKPFEVSTAYFELIKVLRKCCEG